jgi:cytochrome c biogenesis protein CcmG/thiol:disulfide interchange protein DsbE
VRVRAPGPSFALLTLALWLGGCGPAIPQAPVRELPDLVLQNLEGRDVPLRSFRGKILLVDFWATWCGPCEESIPHLIKLQERYRARGLQVLGIALDVDGARVVAPFVKKHGMNYPVLLGDEATTRAFGGILGVPTSFLFDREGKVVKRFVGVVDHQAYEAVIRKLL